MINATPNRRPISFDSFKNTKPTKAVPPAPMPTHTAYAVPTGNDLIANDSEYMLAAINVIVNIDGIKRVKERVCGIATA